MAIKIICRRCYYNILSHFDDSVGLEMDNKTITIMLKIYDMIINWLKVFDEREEKCIYMGSPTMYYIQVHVWLSDPMQIAHIILSYYELNALIIVIIIAGCPNMHFSDALQWSLACFINV